MQNERIACLHYIETHSPAQLLTEVDGEATTEAEEKATAEQKTEAEVQDAEEEKSEGPQYRVGDRIMAHFNG